MKYELTDAIADLRAYTAQTHTFWGYFQVVSAAVAGFALAENMEFEMSFLMALGYSLFVFFNGRLLEESQRASFQYFAAISRYKERPESGIEPEFLECTVREVVKQGRGCSLEQTLAVLNPKLRGWSAYFKLTETTRDLQDLDGWIRRKLRCVVWRQWKSAPTRARELMHSGLEEAVAYRSAYNGRGPWWHSGAPHMNAALPNGWFDRKGLVSLRATTRRLRCQP